MGKVSEPLRIFIPGSPIVAHYDSKIAEYAQKAVNGRRWTWPPACQVTVVHWNANVRRDWGSVYPLLDAMRGIVYPDDRRRFVRGGGVFTDFDGGEEGVEIIVAACESAPEIVRRKCGFCLDSRPGVRAKPFVCGRCAARRRRNLIA